MNQQFPLQTSSYLFLYIFQNLRDELRAPVSEKAEFFSVGQQEEDKENNPVPTGETKTKGRRGDKSKVSFASEVMIARRNDIIHGCSSDTEIGKRINLSEEIRGKVFTLVSSDTFRIVISSANFCVKSINVRKLVMMTILFLFLFRLLITHFSESDQKKISATQKKERSLC